jgi:hypothetical protein
MRGKDVADVVLGVSPIPIIGGMAALRYIENTRHGLDEAERVSNTRTLFASTY